MDWLMPGGKEAKIRAEAVSKRRNSASALVSDLSLEADDLKVSLELDSKDYPAADIKKFRDAVERCNAVMQLIYNDLTFMADRPVPERITEQQAFELVQPALRLEGRVPELRQLMDKAREARRELTQPRDEAAGNIADAERRRLQAEIDIASLSTVIEQLKAAYAENYPQSNAAFQTASSEVKAASQMVSSARIALDRKSWREANDLARRSMVLFDSAAGKFSLIRSSQNDYASAAEEADDAIREALQNLNIARTRLQQQGVILSHDVNHYLSPAVQRLGEARRAYHANPPQYVSALRLAKEASTLLEQGITTANEEVYKLSGIRIEAHSVITQLNEAVQNLRVTLNSMRTVPVRANDLYTKARDVRDRLLPHEFEIDQWGLAQLADFTSNARQALQNAQEGLRLVSGGPGY